MRKHDKKIAKWRMAKYYQTKNVLITPSATSNKAYLNEISQPCRRSEVFVLATLRHAPTNVFASCVKSCFLYNK